MGRDFSTARDGGPTVAGWETRMSKTQENGYFALPNKNGRLEGAHCLADPKAAR
jgi:hypothetical protein